MFPTRRMGTRGPQVGPHTFDGRSGGGPAEPGPISAIAWSPGPSFPATELWCFLTNVGGSWQRIDADTPLLWLDLVPEEDEFTPPPGQPATGPQTRAALRAWAADRLWLLSQVQTEATDWVVQVMRPGPGPDIQPSKKIAPGVYTVFELEVSTTTPMAWVWVPAPPDGREIWLLYLPLSPQGMHIVGMPSEGESDPWPATRLRFDRDTSDPDASWSLAAFPAAVAAFKEYALATMNCPAQDAGELELHDYRVNDS